MSGFIAMQREALDHHLIGQPDHFYAWFWLVANACWKPTKTRIKGDTVTLDRGELSFSVRFLADRWGWSKSKVDRFIAQLRAEGMIETRSKNGSAAHQAGQGQSILSICNYSKYQDLSDDQRDNAGTWDRGGSKTGTTMGQQAGQRKPRSTTSNTTENQPSVAEAWDNDRAESGTTAGQPRDKEEQGNKGTREEDSPPTPPKEPKPKSIPVKSIDLPDWLPRAVWHRWVSHRRSIRCDITSNTAGMIVAYLDQLREQGHDPIATINHSIMRGLAEFEPPPPPPQPAPPANPRRTDRAEPSSSRRRRHPDEPTIPFVRAAIELQADRAAGQE